MKPINTRYAPSPTGKLHVGGARTAIFNYLFAKKNHGNFILRIEDTDPQRNEETGIDSQYDNLKWLKIFPDESFKNPGVNGPYLQSQKLLTYKKIAYRLLEENLAYRCFCPQDQLVEYRKTAKQNKINPRYPQKCRKLTTEEIEKFLADQTPFVIRLKIPQDQIVAWEDLIRGEVRIPTRALSDYVILRSNGIPTYNFAVVIDDYDMKITHVLRGEEHLANTPYQIATYQALGWQEQIPSFGHLSMIVNQNGKKISKRDPQIHLFIEKYRNLGYLPEAIVNFLALLGWPGKNQQEIMTIKEMIENFDVNQLNKSPCFFDLKKLNWMANQYFKKLPPQTYWNFVSDFFNIDLKEFNNQKQTIALLFQKQISYAKQLNDLAYDLLITKPQEISQIIENHHQLFINSKNLIFLTHQFFISDQEWTIDKIRAFLKQIMAKSAKKNFAFFLPLRLIFSLKNQGPELFKIMHLIGHEKCWQRLDHVFNWLKTYHG